jgi:tripartite-type tricarboxylate transporter receptor subunit TctC
MNRLARWQWALIILFCSFTIPASTALGADFYKGKTIRFIVGYSAGGGYDTVTRLVARHIGNHIPGSPGTAVENMAGAGSLVAANYTYNKAQPDGLTIGVWNAQDVFNGAMDDPAVKMDARKLEWIGSPGAENVVCAIMGFTGLKTLADIQKSGKTITMGATRAGNTVHLPLMLNKWADMKFKVIRGYKGTSKIRLAMKSKEVQGACWTWLSMRSTAAAMLHAKGDDRLIPFVIDKKTDDPELKYATIFRNVFTGKNLKSFEVWHGPGEMARPFSLPPATPKERVAILRTAFEATLKDPAFLKDVKKAKLDVGYVSGEEIEQIVKRIYSMPPEVKENLRFLMGKSKKKS